MRANNNKLLFCYFVLTAIASMYNWVWCWTELNQIQIVTLIFIQMNYLCTLTVFFLTDDRVFYGAAGELFSGKSYSDRMEMIYYSQSLDTNVIALFAEPCSVLLRNESKWA